MTITSATQAVHHRGYLCASASSAVTLTESEQHHSEFRASDVLLGLVFCQLGFGFVTENTDIGEVFFK